MQLCSADTLFPQLLSAASSASLQFAIEVFSLRSAFATCNFGSAMRQFAPSGVTSSEYWHACCTFAFLLLYFCIAWPTLVWQVATSVSGAGGGVVYAVFSAVLASASATHTRQAATSEYPEMVIEPQGDGQKTYPLIWGDCAAMQPFAASLLALLPAAVTFRAPGKAGSCTSLQLTPGSVPAITDLKHLVCSLRTTPITPFTPAPSAFRQLASPSGRAPAGGDRETTARRATPKPSILAFM